MPSPFPLVQNEEPLHDCSAAHSASVLFFANQCLITVGMLLGAPGLTEARLPYVEEALNPNLKPSRQFGGVLAYTTGGYTDNVIEQSQDALEKLRQEFREVDLADRLIEAIEGNDFVQQEYGERAGETIREAFVPEGHLSHHRQKISLRSTIDEPGKDEAEELRQRTNWMLMKSNSSQRSPSLSSMSELFGRRDSLTDEPVEDRRGVHEGKSREDYLSEVLVGSIDLNTESQRLPDFDLGDPPLGFIP